MKETITPEKAKKWLEHNANNRPLRQGKIDMYARDMKRGEWAYNGETIKFDKNGNLVDGQHRLMACIRSGVSFVTDVVRDVEPDKIDIGTSRTYVDNARMNGFGELHENKYIASAARQLLALETKGRIGLGKGNLFSHAEIYNFINENRETFEKLRELTCKSSNLVGRKRACACAIYYAIKNGVADSVIRRFMEVGHSGICDNKYDTPAVILRNELLKNLGVGSTHTVLHLFDIAQNVIFDMENGNSRRKAYSNPKNYYSACYEGTRA